MAPQYIFTMHRLTKAYPARQDGAQGHHARVPTRARRSACSATTARASRRCCGSWPGVDTDFRGEAQLAPGATVGLLEQEPHLDEAKDVRGNVEDGVAEIARAARPLQRARRQLLRRDRRRVRAPPGADRRRRRLEPRHERRVRDGRAAPAARRRRRHEALRRRAPPRRAVPAAAQRARPAAARRADQPPRRRVGRLARAAPRRVQGHRRRRHPRSLLPRQRRRLDPRARPRPRASPTRATTRAGSSRSRRASRRRSAPRRRARSTIAAELEWVRQNPKGRQTKPKARLHELRGAARRGAQRQARRGPDPHPGRPAPRRRRRRGRGPAQGLRRQAADRGPDASRCRAAASSA